MLGEHEAGILGDRIITWKTVAQERLDSKTLKVEHPTLYKKYANKTSYRRFSIKAAS
jgi:predicted phage-related endonuclease